MLQIGQMVLAILIGMIGSLVYFGGLWWTVQRIGNVRYPLRLYFASVFVRWAVVCAVFMIVLWTLDLYRLLACLAAFVATRIVVVRQFGRPPARKVTPREVA